jgi:hypothetical protein
MSSVFAPCNGLSLESNPDPAMVSILQHFRRNLLKLIDTQIPIQLVMRQFATSALPYKKMIKQHNAQVFEKNIFGEQVSNLIDLQALWKSKELTDDDRDSIWNYFNVFIQLAEKFRE